MIALVVDDDADEEDEDKVEGEVEEGSSLLLFLSSLSELGDKGSSFILCHQAIYIFNFSHMKEFRLPLN